MSYLSEMRPTDPPRTYYQLTVSRTLGGTDEVSIASWPHPDAQNLVDVSLIKCCMKQTEHIWSQPQSFKLIRMISQVHTHMKIRILPRTFRAEEQIYWKGIPPCTPSKTVCCCQAVYEYKALVAFYPSPCSLLCF